MEMRTYIYAIQSAREIPLDQLHQEISIIIDDYISLDSPSKMQRVPSLNCILLTAENHKLVSALLKNTDYTMTEVTRFYNYIKD